MIVLLYLYFICGDLFFIVTQDFVIRREYIKDFDCLFRKKNNKFIIYGLCWILNILDVVCSIIYLVFISFEFFKYNEKYNSDET